MNALLVIYVLMVFLCLLWLFVRLEDDPIRDKKDYILLVLFLLCTVGLPVSTLAFVIVDVARSLRNSL